MQSRLIAIRPSSRTEMEKLFVWDGRFEWWWRRQEDDEKRYVARPVGLTKITLFGHGAVVHGEGGIHRNTEGPTESQT